MMIAACVAAALSPAYAQRSIQQRIYLLPAGRHNPPPLLCQQPRLNRKQRRQHLQPPGTPPPPPAQPATTLTPATLAGVDEDHAYEQFYFDAQTRAKLEKMLSSYQRPLFVGVPSLAVDADTAGTPYLLLDRDERFGFLSGYRHFEFEHPAPISDYEYDVVLCDPPFANLPLDDLRVALESLAVDDESRAAPLYVAYNARREAALLEAFPGLERKSSALGYESVKSRTQQQIILYGSTCAASLDD